MRNLDSHQQKSSGKYIVEDVTAVEGIDDVTLDVSADGAASSTIYDLSGRRVQHPSHGLYIQRGRVVLR